MDITKWEDVEPSVLEMVGQTDRACAITAASLVETFLEDVLRRAMSLDAPEELFSAYGPLNTFAGKIDLAFAFGLVSASEAKDLHVVRRVRNHCAHSLDPAAFDQSPLIDYVRQLRFTRSSITTIPSRPRIDFIAEVAVLIGFLQGRMPLLTRPKEPSGADSLLREAHKLLDTIDLTDARKES